MPDKYWVGGTDTWNATVGSKWSLTSGGAGGAAIPTITDAVFINNKNAPNWAALTSYALGVIRSPLAVGNGFFYEVTTAGISGAVEPTWPTTVGNTVTDGTITWTCRRATVTNTTASTGLSINFTGFTGAFSMPANWNIQNSVTLVNTMTMSGTGTLNKSGNGAASYTSNGLTFTGSLGVNVSASGTISYDNWVISGSWISANANTVASLIGNSTITVGGTLSAGAGITVSNVKFILNGAAGSFSGSYTDGTFDIVGNISQGGQLTFSRCTFSLITGGSYTSNPAFVIAFGTGISTFNNVSSITFGTFQYAAGNPSVTINSNMNCINLTPTVAGILNGVGNTLFVNGNISNNWGVSGTATIEMTGSTPATVGTGSTSCNFIVNKTGVGTTVTFNGAFSVGAAGKVFNLNTAAVFGLNAVSLAGTSLTVNNPSGSIFYDLTIGTANTTMTFNHQINVTRSLAITGTTTFAGAYGFTCKNFTCTAVSSVITFQNIVANPLAQYIVNGILTISGAAGVGRITLQAAGSATFTGTVNPVNQVNLTSGVAPSVGMTLSQSTGASPSQFDPTNRPVITSVITPGSVFGITPSAGATIGSFIMRAGYKAKFTLTNNGTSSQNVSFTATQDIDSSEGITILSFGSYSDSIGQPAANLFRTLNWGPLIAPSGSAYFTFVN